MSNRADPDTILKFPILIGDIGGTNARFAILIDSYADPKLFPTVKTADFSSIDDAIQASVLDRTSVQPRSAVLAVAGPVKGDEVDLTNCDWVVRPNEMARGLGLCDIIILNDFEAQALAVVSIDDEHLEPIKSGTAHAGASRVVLGPGTGLGVAGLIHMRHSWIPVPGEAGHMDMGPRTPRDFELFPYLETIAGRISAEQLLCGRGLVNIHRAIAKAGGNQPPTRTPAEITAAGLDGSDASCVEALGIFVACLGRFAGDLALVFMSRGGVYLTGGIAQKIIPALKDGRFRDAFEDKAPHQALLRDMPVYVITHPMASVMGLAAYGRTPSRFGIETTGRRWSTG